MLPAHARPTDRRVVVQVVLTPEDRWRALAEDAREGLRNRPKSLSPVWLYDQRGSELFDQITQVPEYGVTRAERSLLEERAGEIANIARADTLIELGSGTSDKTRLLLDAMATAGTLRRYGPLDVSEETLRGAANQLAADYPSLEVHAVVGDFRQHLSCLSKGDRRLVAFLGSTIGNLTPADRLGFLLDLADTLNQDDRLLLGVDLVKEPTRMIAAYDDAGGVTAEFNRNALQMLNTELGGSFDPRLFDHVAIWDADRQWIEMRLRSTVDQVIHLSAIGLDVHFARGQDLRTEISAKFTREGIAAELDRAGIAVERAWAVDEEFLLVLARRSS